MTRWPILFLTRLCRSGLSCMSESCTGENAAILTIEDAEEDLEVDEERRSDQSYA